MWRTPTPCTFHQVGCSTADGSGAPGVYRAWRRYVEKAQFLPAEAGAVRATPAQIAAIDAIEEIGMEHSAHPLSECCTHRTGNLALGELLT